MSSSPHANPAPNAKGQPATGGPESAIRSVKAHFVLWTVALLGLWGDLASKEWAFGTLTVEENRPLLGGVITASRSLNSGALFGAFSGWVGAFIVASVLALVFVLYGFACSGRKQRALHVGLGLILAGALGNLYDRAYVVVDVVELKATADAPARQDIGLITSPPDSDRLMIASYPEKTRPRQYAREDVASVTRQGVVRDFIKFTPIAGFDYWPWVFNIADALLVVGVGTLMLTFWAEHRAAGRLAVAKATA
ncbi:MAG: signal peptidase II [bacterium]|nr:signal peptidase II [bacterium]